MANHFSTLSVVFVLLGSVAVAQEPIRTTVYTSDFANKDDAKNWNRFKKGIGGETKFNGPFKSYGQGRLILPKLDPHQFVRVKARIVVAGSLDGKHPKWGPDNWAIGTESTGTVFVTSFASMLDEEESKNPESLQNFPDEIYGGLYAPATGAKEVNSRALEVKSDPKKMIARHDATYDLDVTFPHTEESLHFFFLTFFDPQVYSEIWAFEKVEVEIITGAEPRSEEELAKLWSELSGKDPMVAHRALWKLSASGRPAVEFVAKRWAEVEAGKKDPEYKEKFAAQLKLLSSDEYIDRASAKYEITKLGEEAVPLVEAVLKNPKTPIGVKSDLKIVLNRLVPAEGSPPDPVAARVAHLKRLFRTRGMDYKVTASRNKDAPVTANDGLWPTRSTQDKTPRFTYYNFKGATEWLQYDFPEKRRVSAGEVYWLREIWHGGNKLPADWRLKWRDTKGVFHEVKAKGGYGVAEDVFNRVEFDPVETTAIRLEIDVSETNSAGIHEFRLDEKPVSK